MAKTTKLKEKIKIEVGRTYKTFNHQLIKIEHIDDNKDQLTKIMNISQSSREWLPLARVEDKVIKLIR